MNQSQKRREDLLKQTRNLYSDNHIPPAIHPRYSNLYSELYSDTDNENHMSFARFIICLLLFVCYAMMDYRNVTIMDVNSRQIEEVISENWEILYEENISNNSYHWYDRIFNSM